DVVRRETSPARAGRGAHPAAGPAPHPWNWDSDEARALRDALTTLYGYLIAPVQDEVARAQTLVIMPGGPLCYLPFQALARESASMGSMGSKGSMGCSEPPNSPLPASHTPHTAHTAGLRFLIEDRPLAVLPSMALWNRIRQQVPAGSPLRDGQLAAFGNPDGT